MKVQLFRGQFTWTRIDGNKTVLLTLSIVNGTVNGSGLSSLSWAGEETFLFEVIIEICV